VGLETLSRMSDRRRVAFGFAGKCPIGCFTSRDVGADLSASLDMDAYESLFATTGFPTVDLSLP